MIFSIASRAVFLCARAHAHNDYAHKRPLEEALENGFCSIEADVFLVEGKLLVGHDRKDLTPQKTLERLYLDPLYTRFQKNRGSIYPQKHEVILLVDIKEDGEAVWSRLSSVLERYKPMLSTFEKGKLRKRALRVILSGDRPVEALAKLNYRTAFIDGRPIDLENKTPNTLVPLVSESYFDTFHSVSPNLDKAAMTKLKSWVDTAHKQGKIFRFWAAPDTEKGWQMLYEAGVDLINTDKLSGLHDFLKKRKQ